MGGRKLKLTLRYTALALAVLGAFALLPAETQAQCEPPQHGVSIFKSCTSPKNRCGADEDCTEANLCNAQCATEENPGSNVVDCDITLLNPESHCDDVTLVDAADEILNATGPAASSSALLITSATGVVSGTCTAGTDLGGATTCTIAPGGEVHFQANYYTVIPTDPTTLIDLATISVRDTCNNSTSGCSTIISQIAFADSTTTQSGCRSGPIEIICLLRSIVLIEEEIILLPGELFPAPGTRQALLSGLNTVERKLQAQSFDDASEVLGTLLKHLDGCASADGTPDRNDWISSCAEQIRIRSLIDQLIAEIADIPRRFQQG